MNMNNTTAATATTRGLIGFAVLSFPWRATRIRMLPQSLGAKTDEDGTELS